MKLSVFAQSRYSFNHLALHEDSFFCTRQNEGLAPRKTAALDGLNAPDLESAKVYIREE